jgi:hypothetical protein
MNVKKIRKILASPDFKGGNVLLIEHFKATRKRSNAAIERKYPERHSTNATPRFKQCKPSWLGSRVTYMQVYAVSNWRGGIREVMAYSTPLFGPTLNSAVVTGGNNTTKYTLNLDNINMAIKNSMGS